MRLSPWSIDSFMHSLNIHVKPTLYQSQARDAKLVIAPTAVEALSPSMTGRGVSVVVGVLPHSGPSTVLRGRWLAGAQVSLRSRSGVE